MVDSPQRLSSHSESELKATPLTYDQIKTHHAFFEIPHENRDAIDKAIGLCSEIDFSELKRALESSKKIVGLKNVTAEQLNLVRTLKSENIKDLDSNDVARHKKIAMVLAAITILAVGTYIFGMLASPGVLNITSPPGLFPTVLMVGGNMMLLCTIVASLTLKKYLDLNRPADFFLSVLGLRAFVALYDVVKESNRRQKITTVEADATKNQKEVENLANQLIAKLDVIIKQIDQFNRDAAIQAPFHAEMNVGTHTENLQQFHNLMRAVPQLQHFKNALIELNKLKSISR